MKRLARIVLGIMLIILGVVGVVLPLLQGWLFLAMGALLLSKDVPVFGRMVAWISQRFPSVDRTIKRILKAIPVL